MFQSEKHDHARLDRHGRKHVPNGFASGCQVAKQLPVSPSHKTPSVLHHMRLMSFQKDSHVGETLSAVHAKQMLLDAGL